MTTLQVPFSECPFFQLAVLQRMSFCECTKVRQFTCLTDFPALNLEQMKFPCPTFQYYKLREHKKEFEC